MKCNENLKVIGDKVMLVPYLEAHVPKYHTWMQNEELQQLTASEPLTLTQEYEMQQSWREDEQSNKKDLKLPFLDQIMKNTFGACELFGDSYWKFNFMDVVEIAKKLRECTFIVLDSEEYQRNGNNEIESMVGDVNLFLNDEDDPHTAEIEIMIAESSARGRGLGKEALCSMMRYGYEVLGLTSYTSKIGYSNQPSINMFTKLGFQEVSRSDVFEEITYRLELTDDVRKAIQESTSGYSKVCYR